MSFFEPPPAPPEPPSRPPFQPWMGPPRNVLGHAVPLNLLVGRSATAAVFVASATVYPESFEFELEVRHKLEAERLFDPFHAMRRPGSEALPPEQLRFGVQFADGRKATNLGSPGLHPPADPAATPPQPVLRPGGGGGGDGRWHQQMFLWPLPPPGPLAFVCEWPAAAIELSRVEVDAELLRAASSRPVQLWDEDLDPSWAGGAVHQVVARATSTEAERQPSPDAQPRHRPA